MNKQNYLTFCTSTSYFIPIFFQPFWLDAVTNEEWDIVLKWGKDNTLQGVLPYWKCKKWGLTRILMPPLTPYGGSWVFMEPMLAATDKSHSLYSYEREVMTDLIAQLPTSHFINLCLSPQCTNWLPYLWKGYEGATRYTYVLKNLRDLDTIWENFKPARRNHIKKAEKIVQIQQSEDANLFYRLNQAVFVRQNKKMGYSQDFFLRLDAALAAHKARKIFVASNQNDSYIHTAIYVVYDKQCAYLLASGCNPDFRKQDAESLLTWHSIKDAGAVGLQEYDFEGSIQPHLSERNETYGAERISFLSLKKSKNMGFYLLNKVARYLKSGKDNLYDRL